MNNLFFPTALIAITGIFVTSCGNLSKAKLEANPDFEINSEKFVVTSPIVPTSGTNKYLLENPLSNQIYNFDLRMEDSDMEITILSEKETDEGVKTKSKETTHHKLYITNPVDSSNYEVTGTTTYFRTKEEEESESFETGELVYPINFQIFENGNNVGIITIDKGKQITLSIPVYIVFHNNNYSIEYQNAFNKIGISFEDRNGLAALISLKPKSFITTKMKGEILIKKGLVEELKPDILSLYLMIEGTLKKIK
jgi:hypothetical protein